VKTQETSVCIAGERGKGMVASGEAEGRADHPVGGGGGKGEAPSKKAHLNF